METVHGRRTCDVQVDQALLDATNLPLVAAPGSLALAIVEPRSGLAHSEARDDRAWPPRVGACNRGSAPHFCHSAQQLHAALRFLKPSDCQPSPAAPPRRAKVTRGHPAPEASGRMKPSRSSIRSTAVQISQEKKRGAACLRTRVYIYSIRVISQSAQLWSCLAVSTLITAAATLYRAYA